MLVNQIESFIETNELISEGTTVILGLSGGPDSIFLLHFLARKYKKDEIKLIAAHLDHEWRTDSDKDAQFCLRATQAVGVPLVSRKMSNLGSQAKSDGSKEELGRIMRRRFLQTVAKEYDAILIALAHHLQDQEETFIIRLIRGTSLTGLTAMKPKRGLYIRPLLEVNKRDILAYLDRHNIAYLTDPSNESPQFLRNRIRNSVLPPLHACDERFSQNFLTTLNRLKATEQFLEQLTTETFTKITETKENITQLHVKPALELHPVMRYRVIMHWLTKAQVPFPPTQRFLDEILRFFERPGSKEHQIHEKWRIVKQKEWVSIDK